MGKLNLQCHQRVKRRLSHHWAVVTSVILSAYLIVIYVMPLDMLKKKKSYCKYFNRYCDIIWLDICCQKQFLRSGEFVERFVGLYFITVLFCHMFNLIKRNAAFAIWIALYITLSHLDELCSPIFLVRLTPGQYYLYRVHLIWFVTCGYLLTFKSGQQELCFWYCSCLWILNATCPFLLSASHGSD